MNKPPVNFDHGDDLSDFLGQPSQGARPLPQDDASVRIRQSVPAFEESCRKCRGTGTFQSYSGRSLGPCFACKGKGKFAFKSSPEVREQGRQYRASLPGKRWDAFQASHPAEAAWILKTAQTAQGGFRDVVLGIKNAVDRYGDLSDGRMRVVQGGLARDAQRAEQQAQQAVQRDQRAEGVDASKVTDAIRRGKEAGLKWICLRFQGLVIYEAKKYPGTLYVKTALKDGVYLGSIKDGRFLPSRECTPELQAKVILVASDPAAAAKVYGLETNECCVCGRELTNKESVETGIGPICSGRLGWTPGGLVRKAGVDF